MSETTVVKKPSKKERILAKREEREKMFTVHPKTLDMTLECPICRIQQTMTLDEYFTKINYGSLFPKKLHCEICPSRPELMFYKVNRQQIMQAGFNWQREKMGIGTVQMHERIEAVENISNQTKSIISKKSQQIPEKT